MSLVQCPDGDDTTIPIKIKHKKSSGGKKLKSVLKAIANDEDGDDEPKVSVVRVPAPKCPAAADAAAAPASCKADKAEKKDGADAEEVGKKAGKEAKHAVEKALKKAEDKQDQKE